MKIRCSWHRLPLAEPYRLSFGTFREYDTFFAVAEDAGRLGWGETTALPGYSWESSESIRSFISKALGVMESSGIEAMRELLESSLRPSPFAATPLLTALEMLEEPQGHYGGPFRAALTGLVSGSGKASLKKSLDSMLSSGCKTFKLKVGSPNADDDIKKVRILKGMLPSGTRLRLDANQACSFDGAKELLKWLEPSFVELFEQPFPPDAWDMTAELRPFSKVPLMLDESIWTEEDIRRAAKEGAASIVKLKLFKHGSPRRTERLVRLAKSLALGVVLGNGVQTEAASLLEASTHSECGLDAPGEMNGGFKLPEPATNVSESLSGGFAVFRLDGDFKIASKSGRPVLPEL